MNSKIDTREITIIYMVYYKLIKTTIAPKDINSSAKRVTMLMEKNKSTVLHLFFVCSIGMRFFRIMTGNSNLLLNPVPFNLLGIHVESITQFSDGSIKLMFSRSNSFNQDSSSRRISSVRPSSSKNQEDDEVS